MKDIDYKIEVYQKKEVLNKKGIVLDGVDINFRMNNGFVIVEVSLINIHDAALSYIIRHSTCFRDGNSIAEKTEGFPVLQITDLGTIVYHDTQMEIGKALHLPEMFDRHKVSEAIINRITLIVSNINKFKSGIYLTKKYSFLPLE